MRRVLLALISIALLGAAAPVAQASRPPGGDDPGGGNDSNRDHVHRLKPWKPRFEYQMERDAPAHAELNGRSDLSAQVLKGQWWKIDCQMSSVTQNGPVLWDHIPNVGWVADQYLKTYIDGRIPNSPTCAVPGPNHVWYQQPWGLHKEYRLKHNAIVRDRPGGAPAGKTLIKDGWVTTNCHQSHRKHEWVFLDLPGTASGYIPADALRYWQKGLPAGMPKCVKPPPPLRTWVAMGDSYASGQGANDYSGGDCRRSANSYWALLNDKLKHGLVSSSSDFVACSGATSGAIEARQLGALDPATRLVTLSAGGNNMGFKAVLTSCVEPGGEGCEDAVASHFTRSRLAQLKADLAHLYRAIRNRAPQANVLVLGYPNLVPRDHVDGCLALDDGNADELHGAQVKINRAIQAAIGKRRGFRFVSLVRTFRDHPACNDDAPDWINGVMSDREESFHPNESGHRAIAAHLEAVAPQFFR